MKKRLVGLLSVLLLACVGDDTANPKDGGSDATANETGADVITGDSGDAGPPPSGTIEWLSVYTTNEPGDLISDAAHVAIAPDGTIAILGQYSGPTNVGSIALTPTGTGAPVFAAKLDSTGKVLWAKSFGNLGAILPSAIAMNAIGDVYVGLGTGGGTVTVDGISTTDSTSGAFGCSIFKLAHADGKAVWGYGFGGSSNTQTVFLDGLAVNGTTVAAVTHFNGSVQVVGTTSTGFTIGSVGQDALMSLHDDTQQGKIATFRVMGSTGTDWITSIASDGTGSWYIGGSFSSALTNLGLTVSGGTQNTFLAKVDASITKVWAQNLGGAAPTSNIGHPLALAADSSGVYFTGGLWGYTSFNAPLPSTTSAGGEDGFLAKALTTDGTLQYARAIGGASDDESSAIATGPNDFIAIAGYYTSSSVTIGSVQMPPPQPGKPAAFVARAAGAGTYTWAKGAAAPNASDYVKSGGVAIDPTNGAVVVAGTFSGKVDFGDGTSHSSSSAGAHAAFYVMRIAP